MAPSEALCAMQAPLRGSFLRFGIRLKFFAGRTRWLSLYIGIIFPRLPILVVERTGLIGRKQDGEGLEIVHFSQKMSCKEKWRKIKKKMRDFFQKTLAKWTKM